MENLNNSEVDMELQEITAETSKDTPVVQDKQKVARLPLARVKHIMKMDPDCELVSQEAVFLVTKATEFFLECLSKEVVKQTISSKRKTVLKRDVDAVIDNVANLCFLEGVLE